MIFLFGLVFFIGVLIEYFETGLVTKIPTLIVSSLILWGGVSLWLAGVILHVIVGKHRQLFELQMNILNEIDKVKNKGDEL